jgi:hypothetical protein
MSDPVIDPEGNSFEREAIVRWLETRQTSPITRSRLTVDRSILSMIYANQTEKNRANGLIAFHCQACNKPSLARSDRGVERL